jgi:anti-sigma B factor antagonist
MEIVSTLNEGAVAILQPRGETITPENAYLFRDAVAFYRTSGYPKVIIDMSSVSWIGSVGLNELVRAHNAAKLANGWLKIFGLTDNVQKMLQLTKLITIFDIYGEQR